MHDVSQSNPTIKSVTGGAGNSGLVDMQDVIVTSGLSRADVLAKARAGSFPSPYLVGPESCFWRVSDLNAWMNGARSWNPTQPLLTRHMGGRP